MERHQIEKERSDTKSFKRSDTYSSCVNKTYNGDFTDHAERIKCNEVIEEYQQKYIYNFYDSYVDALDNVRNTKPELLKRTFENYMESVENSYISKIHTDMCEKMEKNNMQSLSETTVRLHKDHDMDSLKTLNFENYVLYKILYVNWVNEHIKKDDVQLLSPCRIFIIQSIIKRRYQESIVFKSSSEMKNFLNMLPERDLNKREEEIVKYLFKRVIRYIQKSELDSDKQITDKLDYFFKAYFEGLVDRTFFDEVFSHVTKLV